MYKISNIFHVVGTKVYLALVNSSRVDRNKVMFVYYGGENSGKALGQEATVSNLNSISAETLSKMLSATEYSPYSFDKLKLTNLVFGDFGAAEEKTVYQIGDKIIVEGNVYVIGDDLCLNEEIIEEPEPSYRIGNVLGVVEVDGINQGSFTLNQSDDSRVILNVEDYGDQSKAGKQVGKEVKVVDIFAITSEEIDLILGEGLAWSKLAENPDEYWAKKTT